MRDAPARVVVDYADEPHTIIHAMASLVRVAPSYRLRQQSRKNASGVAPPRRTLGTTSGLGPRWVYRRQRQRPIEQDFI